MTSYLDDKEADICVLDNSTSGCTVSGKTMPCRSIDVGPEQTVRRSSQTKASEGEI